MSRRQASQGPGPACFPRPRGDEPLLEIIEADENQFSPPARG